MTKKSGKAAELAQYAAQAANAECDVVQVVHDWAIVKLRGGVD